MSQKIALFWLKIKKLNALKFYLKVIKIKFSPIWYHSKVLIFKKTRLIYVIHIVQSCSLSAHKSFMDLKNTRHTDPPLLNCLPSEPLPQFAFSKSLPHPQFGSSQILSICLQSNFLYTGTAIFVIPWECHPLLV